MNAMKRKNWLLLILCTVLFVSAIIAADQAFFLSRFLPDKSRDLMCESVHRRSSTISLEDYWPSPWDRVYIFFPYSSDVRIQRALGFRWSGFWLSGIRFSDGFNLLVFVKDQQVVNWLRLPRNCGDFEATPGGPDHLEYLRQNAVFTVVEVNYGGPWVVLRAQQPLKGDRFPQSTD
jgi:hypothetical protein